MISAAASSSDPCDLALDYWRRLTAAGTALVNAAFASDDCAGFADNAFLATATETPDGFRVIRAGAAICALLGGDPAGRPVAEVVPAELRAGILDRLDTAARGNRPLRESGSWPLGETGEIRYRAVLMPLADGAGRVDRILGTVILSIERTEDAA